MCVRPLDWQSVCHQPISQPSDCYDMDIRMFICCNYLTYIVDVPLGQFLCMTRIGLVSLRFGNQGLIIDNIWTMSRHHKKIIERGRCEIYSTIINGNTAGMDVEGKRAASHESTRGGFLRSRGGLFLGGFN